MNNMDFQLYVILFLLGLTIVLSLSIYFLVKILMKSRRMLKKEKSRRQSQSTRYGQLSEQFMPFLDDYPGDPKQFRFLGSPIDGVGFEEDKILLTEFKVADSQLTTRQRKIRDMVKDNKVEFVEVRITEKEE